VFEISVLGKIMGISNKDKRECRR